LLHDVGERIISSCNAKFPSRTDQELEKGRTPKPRRSKGWFLSWHFWPVYLVTLGQAQKSEDDVNVRAKPPTIKQNRVGGFRLKACV